MWVVYGTPSLRGRFLDKDFTAMREWQKETGQFLGEAHVRHIHRIEMLKNEMRGKSKRRRMGSEEGSDPIGHSNLSELGGIVDPGLEKKRDIICLEFFTLLYLRELYERQKGSNKVIYSWYRVDKRW